MRKRIFLSICAVAIVSVLALSFFSILMIYQSNSKSTYAALENSAAYLAAALAEEGRDAEGYLGSIRGANGRVTLVAADGTVLFDNREDPAKMENHAARPEIAEALAGGTGRAQRNSTTLDERTLYYALRLEDGSILRLSATVDNVWAEVLQHLPLLLAVAVGIIVLAGLVARWQARRILSPINGIDLDTPLANEAYGELAPLLRRVAAQRAEIDAQVEELRARKEEFSTITQSMAEGLLVLNTEGHILFANDSARRILAFNEEAASPRLLEICRDQELEALFRRAAQGQPAGGIMETGGRQYRVSANPDREGGGVRGVILLLTDDTERLQAEGLRRQFAANVSHELKTPLTSINGYAELIENGLAKPEDIPGFAGRIRAESQRLIALIGDIIRLSQLDEGAAGQEREPVGLLALAREVHEQLRERAAGKGIEVTVSGTEETVQGVRPVLAEVVYNLLDNAISYTPAGGRVAIAVAESASGPAMTIRDNGPGIAAEHKERIFERFYRVDKSHARQSGGTGLGLAIAKHGMQIHGGRVEVESEEGKGSVFTLLFGETDG